MKSNQLGRSMMEMLGVLSIIGVLSVGGFSMVKKMQNSYNTNKVMEEISAFTRRARSVIREYTTSDGKLNNYVKNGKAIPDGVEFISDDDGFEGTSGVTYSFTTNSISNDIKGVLFTIEISNLSEELCMQIATADWGNSSSSGFKGIRINNNDPSTSPLDLGTAAGICEDGAKIGLSYR